MLGFVYIALWARRHYHFPGQEDAP
jgi:hypothetical protein